MAVILPWKTKKEMHEAVGALEAVADTDLHVWRPQAVKMQPHPQESLSLRNFLHQFAQSCRDISFHSKAGDDSRRSTA